MVMRNPHQVDIPFAPDRCHGGTTTGIGGKCEESHQAALRSTCLAFIDIAFDGCWIFEQIKEDCVCLCLPSNQVLRVHD